MATSRRSAKHGRTRNAGEDLADSDQHVLRGLPPDADRRHGQRFSRIGAVRDQAIAQKRFFLADLLQPTSHDHGQQREDQPRADLTQKRRLDADGTHHGVHALVKDRDEHEDDARVENVEHGRGDQRGLRCLRVRAQVHLTALQHEVGPLLAVNGPEDDDDAQVRRQTHDLRDVLDLGCRERSALGTRGEAQPVR